MTQLHEPAVSGTVAPGYEAVREAFIAGAADLGDGGGAFAAYVGGEPVVDLWAGQARPGVPWAADTTTVLMSATKGLAALCAQVLNTRGLLDVEAPVAEYWPEFAQAGKESATVRMVLDHTVGVFGFSDPGSLLDFEGRGWDDYDEIAARLAVAPAAWEPGTKIGYHALTVGWLTGELVRRITGRTIGEFFRSEVAEPLGVTARIGTPVDEQHRVARVIAESYDGLPPEIVEIDRTLRAGFNTPGSLLALALVSIDGSCVIDNMETFANAPAALAAEVAAATGTGNGRDLARIYAMLAAGGVWEGRQIVSPESIELFSTVSGQGRSAITPPIVIGDVTLPDPWTCYGLGYSRNIPEPGMPPGFGPNTETFGHAGHGGQFGFCDPVRGMGVGFVRSHLTLSPHFAAQLVEELYRCAP